MFTDIQRFILEEIAKDGSNVNSRVAEHFGVSRQAVSAHLGNLKKRGFIESSGAGRAVKYELLQTASAERTFQRDGLEEDVVWEEHVLPVIADLPKNVLRIWEYGITEMVNNAVDHSGGNVVGVCVWRFALFTRALVIDDGEGIFLKIQRALGLSDPRQAILELAKGKLTTDPENHTGEGIFFSSKVFEMFDIRSGRLHFMHDDGLKDVLLEQDGDAGGTMVIMHISNDSHRDLTDVFDQFAAPEEYTFARTIVPVRLAQHEGGFLVSRSQAKRLVARFEKFEHVVLDFEGVDQIGQAFADEVFRVFQNRHPNTVLAPINMTQAVDSMVKRALAAKQQQ